MLIIFVLVVCYFALTIICMQLESQVLGDNLVLHPFIFSKYGHFWL